MASPEYIRNHPDILSELVLLAIYEADNGNIATSISETSRALASVNRMTTNKTALAVAQKNEQLPDLSMNMMMARVKATIASGKAHNKDFNFPKYAGFAYTAVKIAQKHIESQYLIPELIDNASKITTDYLRQILTDRNTSIILNEFHNFLDPLSAASGDITKAPLVNYETKLQAGQFISNIDEIIANPSIILESRILTFK